MQVKYRELKQKCLSDAVSHNTSRYQQDEGSQTLYSSLGNAKTPRHVTYEVINVVLKSHLNLLLALSTNTLYFSVPFLSIISFTKCNLACPASEVMTLLMVSKNNKKKKKKNHNFNVQSMRFIVVKYFLIIINTF